MSDPASIPNEMILASAGSGKTYQLTNRYLSLMALQFRSGLPVEPERIIALTFTRKAAGEFFDSILVKLAQAATEPGFGASLAAGRDDLLSESLRFLGPEDYRELLRLFIRKMPRLFLGTLDSFFSGILRSFPSEFGITSDFEVMDQYRTRNAVDRVYASVFSRRMGRSEAHRSAFLEGFRQATFGKEESKVLKEFDRFVAGLHDLYLAAPESAKWGRREAVWGTRPSPFLHEAEIDLEAEFGRLYATFDAVSDRVSLDRWDAFREAAATHAHGAAFSGAIEYMLKKLLPAWSELESGAAEIKFERKVHPFDAVACGAVRRIVQWLVGGLLEVKLRRTRGVWELIDVYESTYSEKVRRLGQLSFQDVLLLLAGHHRAGADPVPRLAQTPGDDARLRIDYRLDARYDHWLLDEFQDTSRMQWRVIENLVDEVVQDTSGTRSLFQVGDVKQAIYGWRGGDSRLFADLRSRYNRREERIGQRALDVSYRSVADVLEPVNALFGDRAALKAVEIPATALERWQWSDHRVGAPLQDRAGFTAFLNPVAAEGEAKPGDDEVHELVLGILDETQPHRRGLSCAILVRSNRRGEAIVDHLRARSEIPVVSEAERHIARDNPLNLALLSLFQLAAHPGDRFAWEHLRMTPYRVRIDAETLSRGQLSREQARRIYEEGFEATARAAAGVFEASIEGGFDAFTRARLDDFLLAASQFEEKGGRDIDDFLLYLRERTARESVDPGSVQVMTYHKAKGLTFDMVILPDLKSDSFTTTDLEIGAKEDGERRIEWVLDLPRKSIVEADPVLCEYLSEKQAESAYESLCLYYVGLTRAKYANYLVALPQGPKSTSMNFVRLLEDVLAGETSPVRFGAAEAELLYASETPWTDRRWFEAFAETALQQGGAGSAGSASGGSLSGDAAPGLPTPRPRPRRRTPSGSEVVTVTGGQIFTRRSNDSRDFGNLVHALFEELEWFDEALLPRLREGWLASGRASGALGVSGVAGAPADLVEAAFAEVERALAAPSVRALFTPGPGRAEVWRERRFEILLGGEWLSGVFDRVVVESGDDGSPRRARIVDFKTDRIADPASGLPAAAAKYRPQLETYREVLACVTGLAPEAIECVLVFTDLPEVLVL